MTRLFLRLSGSLEKVAQRVGAVALPKFHAELRDGLNLGGGDYFKFAGEGVEILLVCNDADHAEVFEPERADFPFYCYVWKGDDVMLESMQDALSAAGIENEIEEEA